MNVAPGKVVVLSSAMLLVGVGIGMAVPDPNSHPNLIQFVVNPASTKVSLFPQIGDHIRWFAGPDQKGQIKVVFDDPSFSPCQQGYTGKEDCIVQGGQGEATWNYTCGLEHPPTDCYDPAVGPVSHKVPGGGWIVLTPVKGKLDHLLGTDQPDRVDVPFVEAPGLNKTKPKAVNVWTPSVSCGAGSFKVFPEETAAEPLLVSPGDIIGWSLKNADFALANPSRGGEQLCEQAGPFTPAQGCKVKAGAKGDYTYTVTVPKNGSGCNASPTEHIEISIKP